MHSTRQSIQFILTRCSRNRLKNNKYTRINAKFYNWASEIADEEIV